MSETTTVRLQSLIDRMNAGEASARDRLIEQTCSRLERIAKRIRRDFPGLRNSEETGDVLQKGIVRLLRALQECPVNDAKQFFRLAALQVRRELLDAARRPKRVRNASEIGTGEGLEARGNSADQEQLAKWTEFHRAVERLPEQERDVFELLWYQGLSQSETAAVLGVSVPTIKRRWLSARLRLRPILGDDED